MSERWVHQTSTWDACRLTRRSMRLRKPTERWRLAELDPLSWGWTMCLMRAYDHTHTVNQSVNQSINQSKHIYTEPYVAQESEVGPIGRWWVSVFVQEGWLSPTERASVSAISLRHLLASSGYTPGTIAVNVTWMERGFSAGQTHSSIYPSIFNRLRAIARYWSEIATFFLLLAFNAPLGVFPLEFRESLDLRKLESWGYQAVKTVWW